MTTAQDSSMYGAMGLDLFAGIYQASAQREAGRANKAIADWNAKVADLQAVDAITRGEWGVSRHRKGVQALVGTQRASFAAQGVVVDQDTAGQVVDQTIQLGEEDAATIRTNAIREAWGFKVQAADQRLRGKLAKAEGDSAAIGTLLTTGARAADTYRRGTE
jgi:hypothetical protein